MSVSAIKARIGHRRLLSGALTTLALASIVPFAAAQPASAQPVVELGLELEKTATVSPNRPGGAQVGDVITYTYEVTNTSTGLPEIPLNPITITDDRIPSSPFNCGNGALLIGQTRTCTATYTVTAADVAAGHVINVATATGRMGNEFVTSNTASVDIRTAGRRVGLKLDKRAKVEPNRHGKGAERGDRIYYTYLVTNTGNVTVTEVRVQDSLVRPVDCPTTPLEPGESLLCKARYAYVVTERNVKAGKVVNTAQATGRSEGGTVTSNRDSVTVRTQGRHCPHKHHHCGDGKDQLPVTGSPAAQMAGVGGGLVALGTVLLGVTRLRRRPQLQL
ncbi:MAG TPA: hypothetical protein VGD43_01635 [Micromonospora sp.]